MGRSKCLTLLAPYEFQGFLAATNTVVKPMIFQGFAQCAISSGTPWPRWFPCKPISRPPTWRSQKTTSALSESGNGFAERSSHCVLIKTSPPQRGGGAFQVRRKHFPCPGPRTHLCKPTALSESKRFVRGAFETIGFGC